MKTFFIPESLYKTSPWDLVKRVGGLPFCSHPLYAGLLIGSKEQYARMKMPDPDAIVKHKLKRLEEAYRQKDVHGYVFTHERPYRFQALLDTDNWELESDGDWFETAGEVWMDAEGPGINAEIWRSHVFCSNSSNRHRLMNEDELEDFNQIKEPITVYRGAGSKLYARSGLSWTTDRDKAIWFAHRFRTKNAWLAEVTVKRMHIAAIFHRRSEAEIILPKVPRGAKVIQL